MRKTIKKWLKPLVEEILEDGSDLPINSHKDITAFVPYSKECDACGKRPSKSCKGCHYEFSKNESVTMALHTADSTLPELQIVKVRVHENGMIYFYCPGDVHFDDLATCDELLAKGIEIIAFSTI